MKDLKTVTEYQLLFLAKRALERAINDINIISAEPQNRKYLAYLKMYNEQLSEIDSRMKEIQVENEIEFEKEEGAE